MDISIQEIIHSPNLPEIITELNRAWSEEQRRREEFYNWVTPDTDIKAEFIKGEFVEQYILKNKKYILQERKRDGIIESVVIPNFRIPVRAMFDKVEFMRTLNSF